MNYQGPASPFYLCKMRKYQNKLFSFQDLLNSFNNIYGVQTIF